jgi:3-hydroxybutyrate dehydrogenase
MTTSDPDESAGLQIPVNATATTAVELSGRVALVTGAASGIGRACAARLAAAGALVRVVDLDDAGARETAAAIGGEPHVVDLAELSNPDALVSLAADADIIVNNAGFQLVRPIAEFPVDVFATMLRVMVEAPFRLVRAALPAMYRQGWGRVVNISSVHGLRASAFKVGYVTAKHALEGFSKTLAVEGGPYGVTSNCVNPGYVRTPLVEKQIADQAVAHGIPEQQVVDTVLLAHSAAKRLIEPHEVAELVAYLCAPQASFITGASLVMDGAWTAQ